MGDHLFESSILDQLWQRTWPAEPGHRQENWVDLRFDDAMKVETQDNVIVAIGKKLDITTRSTREFFCPEIL
jgi:choline kinase